MINAEVIGAVLAKCSAYDSRNTPQPSDIVIDAWLEHFGLYPNVTPGDLMAAVREYYTVRHDNQLTPVDLSSIARNYSRDRVERSDLDSAERRAHEALCDSKAAADDGPPAQDRRADIERFIGRFGKLPDTRPSDRERADAARAELDAIRGNLTPPPEIEP
jgi:hypothetical protein